MSLFNGNILSKIKLVSIIKKCNNYHLSSQLNCKGEKIREILFAPTQIEKPKKSRKVSVIGAAGFVGTACAYNLVLKNICDEIVLLDLPRRKDKLCGEALDYLHPSSIANYPKLKVCFNGENTRDSDLLIIGVGTNTGNNNSNNSYDTDTIHQNAAMFKTLIPTLVSYSPDAVILVISNPVDLMTYAAWRYSGFDKNRIIGTGTELDSSRFRFLIGKRLGISARSINAWIIGEHGKGSIPCWSNVDVAGTRLREIDKRLGTDKDDDDWDNLYKQVVETDHLMMHLKGCGPYWGISTIAENIAAAILGNKKTVHTVSTNTQGIHGIKTETFMSLPVVLGNRGVMQIVKQNLASDELARLQHSANNLDYIKKIVSW